MNKVLETYIQVVPVIRDALGMDIMMSITDGEQFLGYWRGDKMVADIKIGDKLSHDDPMYASFTTGKKIESVVPADIYGFEFRAITLAIRDGATIVGTMGIAISMETESFTKDASQELLKSIDYVQKEMESINGFSTLIRDSAASIRDSTDQILASVSDVQGFAKEIQNISNKTNMLSLNASIEAARSGTFGRGFTVVAEQMRKLANDTKESSEKILQTLKRFEGYIAVMEESLKSQTEAQGKQSSLSEELYGEVKKIEETTKLVIEKISK